MSEPPLFVPAPHLGADPPDPETTRRQRLATTLAEIGACLDDAERLVALGKQHFDDDWIAKRAAKNIVTEFAETVTRLPESYKRAHPGIPWRAISGMRNRVVHVYEDADPDLVWVALAADLPAVRSQLDGG